MLRPGLPNPASEDYHILRIRSEATVATLGPVIAAHKAAKTKIPLGDAARYYGALSTLAVMEMQGKSIIQTALPIFEEVANV